MWVLHPHSKKRGEKRSILLRFSFGRFGDNLTDRKSTQIPLKFLVQEQNFTQLGRSRTDVLYFISCLKTVYRNRFLEIYYLFLVLHFNMFAIVPYELFPDIVKKILEMTYHIYFNVITHFIYKLTNELQRCEILEKKSRSFSSFSNITFLSLPMNHPIKFQPSETR